MIYFVRRAIARLRSKRLGRLFGGRARHQCFPLFVSASSLKRSDHGVVSARCGPCEAGALDFQEHFEPRVSSNEYYSMHPAASNRAGASLLAFLTAPSCRITQRRVCQRAAQLHQSRRISASTRRLQQPAATPSPAPPQAVANTQAASHSLSPSSESEPLRTLETSTDPEPRSLTDQLSDPPPVLGENEKQVDWTRSYHGLSSSPFTAEQAAILQQKIEYDDIEIKPDGIIYLPEIKYRRILNRAFGPGGWGLAPRGETIVTGKIVTREYGLVCGGRCVQQKCTEDRACANTP